MQISDIMEGYNHANAMTPALRDELNVRKKTISGDLMKKLWELQEFMDTHKDLSKVADDTHEEFNEKMMNSEDESGIYQQFLELIGILNQSTFLIPKRVKATAKDRVVRKTYADRLLLAKDPNCKEYGFCPKCSRPMRISRISKHMKDTFICREIKLGRQATLEYKNATTRRNHTYIADSFEDCDNDSEVEEEEYEDEGE